jgi:hypothetical protein
MIMNWNQKIVACWGINDSCVERETMKAVLINGLGWIPKSQCEFGSKERKPFMVIPAWLAAKVMDNYSSLLISEREKDILIECVN